MTRLISMISAANMIGAVNLAAPLAAANCRHVTERQRWTDRY